MKPVKAPRKWKFILIELEIDGKVVSNVIATQYKFQSAYNPILREGQTQRLPWAIYISKTTYYKAIESKSEFFQDRGKNGRFIKIKPILYEDERP